jgi:hypothetical protein
LLDMCNIALSRSVPFMLQIRRCQHGQARAGAVVVRHEECVRSRLRQQVRKTNPPQYAHLSTLPTVRCTMSLLELPRSTMRP